MALTSLTSLTSLTPKKTSLTPKRTSFPPNQALFGDERSLVRTANKASFLSVCNLLAVSAMARWLSGELCANASWVMCKKKG